MCIRDRNLTNQQKGSLLAFVAVMFITPDSLFIRLSNVDTWGLVFYRGVIPFFTVFLGMLLIYKLSFFKMLFSSGYHGLIYIGTFSITNITFVVSIQNTNVANTLVMIATAPLLSAILRAIFLKEPQLSSLELASKGWEILWPYELTQRHKLYQYGLRRLMSFDESRLRSFFSNFFRLSTNEWVGFLTNTLPLPKLIYVMSKMFINSPLKVKLGMLKLN